MEANLFQPYTLGNIELQNRVVMAPMTRCRATGGVPNEIMAQYYQQRSGAGFIITEGASVSPNGMGYAHMPGIFTDKQVEGWQLVTQAVHKNGGLIFAQLTHCGRIGYPENLPRHSEIVGPSSVAAQGLKYRCTHPMGQYVIPRAMTLDEIGKMRVEFYRAALNARKAGFDGVEIQAANESLLEQFLSPESNKRIDNFGSRLSNRCRLTLEIVKLVGEAIGFDKVGIRLSPFDPNSWKRFDLAQSTYDYLTIELNKLGIAYLHQVDHNSLSLDDEKLDFKRTIRKNFDRTIIMTGGMDKNFAQAYINLGLTDLVGFGRHFISNPDLVERMKDSKPLNMGWNETRYFKGGMRGYTDYKEFKIKAADAEFPAILNPGLLARTWSSNLKK
jgi:N-ethylmaleimide reductase